MKTKKLKEKKRKRKREDTAFFAKVLNRAKKSITQEEDDETNRSFPAEVAALPEF